MVPWVSLAGLLGFGLLAYAQVGHWPLYSRPDPKDVSLAGLQIGGGLTLLVFLSALVSLIAMAAISFFTLCTVAERRSLVHPSSSRALYLFGIGGLGLYVFLLTLGAHMNWLMD